MSVPGQRHGIPAADSQHQQVFVIHGQVWRRRAGLDSEDLPW